MRGESAAAAIVAAACALAPARALAVGEAANGYPNWSERVLLEWINRARADPQADLVGCTAQDCPERQCYTPQPPRMWNANVAHSARYHSDEMRLNGYFDHWSECTVVSTIAAPYLTQPQQCDGSAACGCVEQAISHTIGSGTDPWTRMGLFGGGTGSLGEIIAGDSAGPDATFYLWLDEHSSSSACAYSYVNSGDTNGHRWIILTSQYGAQSAGPGVSGSLSTVDFDDANPSIAKLPSGTHYPQQAASVDAWASWYDAAPSVHEIDVDGTCSDMTLGRGSPANGAWHASVSGVGSGCHRYVFAFKDGMGHDVLYPTTGSLAIGDGSAQCPDWSSAAPAGCAGFDRIWRHGFEP